MSESILHNIEKSLDINTNSLSTHEKPNLTALTSLNYYRSDSVKIYDYQLKVGAGVIYWFDVIVIPPTTATGVAYLHAFDSATSVSNGATPDYIHPLSWGVNQNPFAESEILSKFGIPFLSGLYLAVSDNLLTLTKSTTVGVKLQALYY